MKKPLNVVRSILEPMPFICGTYTKRGTITWVNAPCADFFHTTPRHMIGRSVREFWPAAPRSNATRLITRLEHGVVDERPAWLSASRVVVDGEVTTLAFEIGEALKYRALRLRLNCLAPAQRDLGEMLGLFVTDRLPVDLRQRVGRWLDDIPPIPEQRNRETTRTSCDGASEPGGAHGRGRSRRP